MAWEGGPAVPRIQGAGRYSLFLSSVHELWETGNLMEGEIITKTSWNPSSKTSDWFEKCWDDSSILATLKKVLEE